LLERLANPFRVLRRRPLVRAPAPTLRLVAAVLVVLAVRVLVQQGSLRPLADDTHLMGATDVMGVMGVMGVTGVTGVLGVLAVLGSGEVMTIEAWRLRRGD
jgi:hypothetical protein